jgi:2-C-methyl-D-erythritol 4-phosphate cytidylyltransferase
MLRYWVVISAAGTGQRCQSALPKQYLPLVGKTVIEYAIAPFLTQALIEKIVVVLAPNDQHWAQLSLASHPKIITTEGGAERYQSVLNGLDFLSDQADPQDWVLVHDAARPLLQANDLEQLLTQLADHPVGGLLGTPIHATLKKVVDQQVVQTVPRAGIWQALTPQMFRYGLLRTALQQASAQNACPSDDAQAMETCGYQPVIIAGASDNLKITYPNDLVWAEKVLRCRSRIF